MDYKLLIQKLEETTLPHLSNEQAQVLFKQQLAQLKKEFHKSDFKLKRTLQDKLITTRVLENTITELKIQSENLKHQKELTEEQAAFKEQLFTNVSHELRTPLHGILGMSHLLENSPLNEEQQNFTDIIQSSADNLLVIINDLLSLSQINAGKTTLVKEPFNISKFLKDLKGVLGFKAQGKGLKLILLTPPNLPAYLVGDRTRLYQILLNLLNNAIKFTDEGYVALNIYILKQTAEKIKLQFEIQDTGVGIAPEKINYIFENFTQISNGKNDIHEGFGLGLNIVKKLVNMMEGQLKVKSTVNEGTTFSLNLTLDIPSTTTITQAKQNKSTLDLPTSWQQKKLLLIEDNEANIIYAQNLFALGHIPIDLAKDLATANHKIRTKKYDCILSDVKLPDGNSFDLIAQIRGDNSAINQRTPILVLTASANEKEAKNAQKLNVQSYIGKPFPPQLLITEMKKILNKNAMPSFQSIIQPQAKVTQSMSEPYFAHLEKNFKGRASLQIEMFDIFLDQLPIAIEQMGKGLADSDLKVFHYDAHRIKSTINIIGLPKLKPLITKMDEYCYKKINLEELPDLYEKFKAQAAEDVELILARKAVLSGANVPV